MELTNTFMPAYTSKHTLKHLFLTAFLSTVIASEPNVFFVTDDTPAGHRLGRIAHFNGDQHIPIKPGQFRALIARSTRPPAAYFTIDERSGELFTKVLMDREALCTSTSHSVGVNSFQSSNTQVIADCRFQFQVALYRKSDEKYARSNVPEFVDVSVYVNDRNDHVPTFQPNKPVNLSILESSVIGTRIRLPLAIDPDSTMYSIKKYELLPVNTKDWSLHQETEGFASHGVVQHKIVGLFLELRTNLDRERQGTYKLEVKAYDTPDNSPSIYDERNVLKLIVNVEDVNDNGPVFHPLEKPDGHNTLPNNLDTVIYEIELAEANWFKSPILRLQASDKDTGNYAMIRFDFAPNTDVRTLTVFRLNEDSGELFLRQPLDYETNPSYSFQVLAIDSEHERKLKAEGMLQKSSVTNFLSDRYTATAEVRVTVLDLNDETPVIEMDYLRTDEMTQRPATYAKIKENMHPPQFVADLLVTDRDANPTNNHIVCKLQENEQSGSKTKLQPSNLGLAMNVKNLFQLNEMRRQPGQVQYNLLTTGSLDRENLSPVASVLRVGILCSDSGEPPRVAEHSAIVQVEDVNDNAPSIKLARIDGIEHDDNSIELYENSPIGSLVVRFNVTDTDIDQNGYVTCRIEDIDPSTTEYFHIDPVSCDLSIRRPIDRESSEIPLEKLTLLVTAEDHGQPPKASQLQLTINILNQNDNPPTLQQTYYNFNIKENSPVGTSIGQILVRDRDQMYDQISFKFQKQDIGPFTLWPSKFLEYGSRNQGYVVCHINTTEILDRESRLAYEFNILVIDAADETSVQKFGVPQPMTYTVTATVVVTIDDINDNDPIIIFPQQANKTFRLSNRERQNYQLLTVNANDKDEISGPFLFSLLEELKDGSIRNQKQNSHIPPDTNSFLGVESTTGIVYLRRDMCENDTGLHPFHVVVEDNGTPPRSVSLRFLVLVESTPPRSPRIYFEQDGSQKHENNPDLISVNQEKLFSSNSLYGNSNSREKGLRKRVAFPKFTGDAVLILSLGLILLLLVATLCLVIYARRSTRSSTNMDDFDPLSSVGVCAKLCPCYRKNNGDKDGVPSSNQNNMNKLSQDWVHLPEHCNGSVPDSCLQDCTKSRSGTLDRMTVKKLYAKDNIYYHDCSGFKIVPPDISHSNSESQDYMPLQPGTKCHGCASPRICDSLRSNRCITLDNARSVVSPCSVNTFSYQSPTTRRLSHDRCYKTCNPMASDAEQTYLISTETV